MTNDISKTERRLKHSGGETPDLRGVIDGRDPEDVDVFGYQIIYTTGDFTLPRDDLLDKMQSLGMPDWMPPSKVAPHRAFGRMIDDIAEDDEEVEFGGHRIRFDIDSGDSRYSQHFHAKVWHAADEENDTEGKWVDHELGIVRYDSDISDIRFVDRIDEGSALAPLWYDGIKSRARDRFDRHQELHTGDDINNMVYYLARQWTDAIKLRDSCYFVPASYQNIETYIDGFRALYEWINDNYKTTGQTTELFAIEIVDSDRQRQMVEQKVRQEIETEVSNVYDSIVSDVREGAAVDEIAEQVVDDLGDIEGVAERHSATLETELSVKRAMADQLRDLDEDREEVVERALEEAGLDPREEVTA